MISLMLIILTAVIAITVAFVVVRAVLYGLSGLTPAWLFNALERLADALLKERSWR